MSVVETLRAMCATRLLLASLTLVACTEESDGPGAGHSQDSSSVSAGAQDSGASNATAPTDSGGIRDSAVIDAGLSHTSTTDSGTDAGHSEVGMDASMLDAGALEAGADAGLSDADSGALDTGADAAVACSSEAPPHLSRCVDEGELCARWSTDPAFGHDNYFACACRAQTSTRLVWDCYTAGTGMRCPHEAPAAGSSCFGYKSSRCPYPPQTECECPIEGDDPRWTCVHPPPTKEPLASVDPEKIVRDLSEAEQQAWCRWFLELTVPPGFPAPPEVPANAAGYYPDRGCMGCAGGVAVNGMMPQSLPVSACTANLALSTCEAKVAELNDCIRSMASTCWPQPRGCARYFEAAGCPGTIASRGAECPVRIR